MFTLFSTFMSTAWNVPGKPFLCVPPGAHRAYHPEGMEMSYRDAADHVLALQARYRAAGYGMGHRVAFLMENRPEFFLHWFALNGLGASVVPVNPDYRASEIAYLLENAEPELVLALPERVAEIETAARSCGSPTQVRPLDAAGDGSLPGPLRAAADGTPGATTEAILLYTSGTTGRPKGCMQTNHYMLSAAHWYGARGGTMGIVFGAERLYTPMPLFHMAGVGLGPLAMMVSAGCAIITDRFHPQRFWKEVVATRASIVHYLGVVPAMLLEQPESPEEKRHRVKFGLGGGVTADIHRRFHARFGFHLNEGWAMTETGRGLYNHADPFADPRTLGRPEDGFEARVVDDREEEVPPDTPGELVVRFSGPDPRWGFSAGYLKDPEATEHAWRGGWFHTGDTVVRDADGIFRFVDRKKNIIRRSGENIAAAEVETIIAECADVARVAVLAVPDETRQEEVLACIVPTARATAGQDLARQVFEHCYERMAYYKAPGWVLFMDDLPVTTTQKVHKTRIFEPGTDPRTLPAVIDLRELKKRRKPVGALS